MANLNVEYMGIKLRNPIIAGASSLTSDLATLKDIEQAGAGAVVCRSLFEEQVLYERLKLERDLHKYEDINLEMTTIYPHYKKDFEPKEHLYWVKRTKEELSIPVFASLNAVHDDTWLDYSKKLAETGVDGLELNLYSTHTAGMESSDNIENEQLSLVKRIRDSVTIPIAVKLSPYYTNTTNFILQLDQIGVNGFVIFNRFFQSGIDIDTEKSTFKISLTRREDSMIALRYAGLLCGNISASICCNTGITDGEDVVRMILAGADTVEIVSTLYANGIDRIGTMRDELSSWMDKKGYASISDFKGKMSRERLAQNDQWIYKRSQYVKMLMQNSEDLMEQIE
jgi:dihydroorotate dehydrogenase (fumarate)